MNRNYYIFWSTIAIAGLVPQIIAAIAYHRLADHLDNPVKVDVVKPVKVKWP